MQNYESTDVESKLEMDLLMEVLSDTEGIRIVRDIRSLFPLKVAIPELKNTFNNLYEAVFTVKLGGKCTD